MDRGQVTRPTDKYRILGESLIILGTPLIALTARPYKVCAQNKECLLYIKQVLLYQLGNLVRL